MIRSFWREVKGHRWVVIILAIYISCVLLLASRVELAFLSSENKSAQMLQKDCQTYRAATAPCAVATGETLQQTHETLHSQGHQSHRLAEEEPLSEEENRKFGTVGQMIQSQAYGLCCLMLPVGYAPHPLNLAGLLIPSLIRECNRTIWECRWMLAQMRYEKHRDRIDALEKELTETEEWKEMQMWRQAGSVGQYLFAKACCLGMAKEAENKLREKYREIYKEIEYHQKEAEAARRHLERLMKERPRQLDYLRICSWLQ